MDSTGIVCCGLWLSGAGDDDERGAEAFTQYPACPPSIHDNHPLRTARLRLADEIEQIVPSVPNRAASFDWKPDFATFEVDERTKYAASVAMKVAELTAPLNEPHLKEIAAITHESRELRF